MSLARATLVSCVLLNQPPAASNARRPRHAYAIFYRYEGQECSKNIFYGGATPNQQIEPALMFSLRNLGTEFYLVGSDYGKCFSSHEASLLSCWFEFNYALPNRRYSARYFSAGL